MPVRQALGNLVDRWSTRLGIPETGFSERIAGGPTLNTSNKAYASEGFQTGPGVNYSQAPQVSTGAWQGPQISPTQLLQLRSSGGQTSGGTTQQAPIFQQQSQPQQQQDLGDGGYGDYLRSLDDQIRGLDDQRYSQEQIANNSYNQGLNTVNSQYQQGQAELTGNRERTLRDLSQNLMQSWQQGNAQLGVRGASDSSAANQYAFALTKMGNQQRGDVQAQYDAQLFKLKNTYDTETKNLELAKNSQLQQISQWFAEAQQALQGQKGQVALQKSQQALSMAMQMAQQVQQETANRRSILDQWAANNATSFSQLAGQLQQNAQYQAAIPAFQGITGGGQQGAQGAAVGYGQDTRKRDIFGNPI